MDWKVWGQVLLLWEVSTSFGSNITSGFYVNREIVIAANKDAGSYTISGCYLTDGKFLQHGLVTNNGYTYVWTDANSHDFKNVSGESFVEGVNGERILRLRNDGGAVNTSKIWASRTDSANGATETVNIDFR